VDDPLLVVLLVVAVIALVVIYTVLLPRAREAGRERDRRRTPKRRAAIRLVGGVVVLALGCTVLLLAPRADTDAEQLRGLLVGSVALVTGGWSIVQGALILRREHD
jgi:UDP-N-acetylmuramyl pentapeptide phosphotransferase/UDP-N-acetylglucosamine-1-phosphate transferase